MRYSALLMMVGLLSAPLWAASTQNISVSNTPRHVLAVDVNNDTHLDLVISCDGGLQISRGSSSGVFTAAASPAGTSFNPTAFAVVGLFNNDALPDLAVVTPAFDTMEVYLNTGNATTPYNTFTGFTTGDNPVSLVAADFDGDGDIDLATANSNGNSLSVFLNNGAANFGTAFNYGVPSPVSLAVGDLNGDTRPELLAVSTAVNGCSILFNQGNGNFGQPQNVAVGTAPKFVNLRDLNGDSQMDLVVLIEGALNVLAGNGDGSFQAARSNPVFSGSSNFSFGDITTDGISDLVLVTLLGTNAPSIFALAGNGDGTFGAASEFQVNGTATFAATGDFNKDGQLDVAASFGNFGSSTVTVRILDPKPTITTIAPTGVVKKISTDPVTSVTITGTNILAGARVKFGSTSIVPTAVTAPTSLTFNVPASLLLVPGRVDVSVVNADASGNGVASVPLDFSVYATTVGSLVVTNTFDAGTGSLRKALQDAQPADTITFDDTVFNLTNSDAATVINVLSELPALDDGGVTIDASTTRVSINGSGAGSARGLRIISSSNVVRGLSIVGFARSGISISGGAKTNTIGGSRATGTGPNGQGLRIANCGTFGIEISGSGTDGNAVKGCWIGLDSSGLAAQPNLAGILVSGAATNNVIGGSGAGEINAISGNSFEGVTFSDVGTDGNSIVNNVLGAAALATLAEPRSARVSSRETDDIPRRAAVGNGSAGVFISKGTQASSLGGITDGTSNTVANNGGNGIEVRTAASRRNASRGNRVGRNQKGGIALFDGSNDGITPPKDDSFAVVARVSSSRVRVRVQGAVSREGSVELFSDAGSQGSLFAVRSNTASGRFDIEAEVNDGENVTATLTDADGNTSAFQVLGPGLDSDGDGVTDVEEDLAGTDKASVSDVPVLGGTVLVDKAQAAVNFAKAGGDSVKLTLRVDLPAGYTPSGTTIGVKFAGVAERLALVSKGASAKGPATVKVKGTAGSTGIITFSVKKDLRAALSQGGLVDSTTAGVTLGIPVAVTVDTGTTKTLFSGSVNMLYKAAQGKSGKAAKAK